MRARAFGHGRRPDRGRLKYPYKRPQGLASPDTLLGGWEALGPPHPPPGPLSTTNTPCLCRALLARKPCPPPSAQDRVLEDDGGGLRTLAEHDGLGGYSGYDGSPWGRHHPLFQHLIRQVRNHTRFGNADDLGSKPAPHAQKHTCGDERGGCLGSPTLREPPPPLQGSSSS